MEQTPWFFVVFRLFTYKPNLTDTVTFGNGLGQFQLAAKAFRNPPVAAHGVVAQQLDLLIGAALLLPCLHQRAVVEIDIQIVIGAALDIHLKDPLGGLGEQGLLQTLQRLTAAGLLAQIGTLIQTAALDGSGGIFLGIQSLLLRFVAEQVHPQSPVLQLFPDGRQQRVLQFGFIDNTHNVSPLYLLLSLYIFNA